MQDTERIQRLAGLLRERKDAMEIVNQIKGGRKKYAGDGKKAISSLQSDYPQKFQSMTPFVPLVPGGEPFEQQKPETDQKDAEHPDRQQED